MRRSVNQNITKPLKIVLIRQNLWQVTQLSAFLYNEPNREGTQSQNTSDDFQATEKCIPFESVSVAGRYPGGHCEVIHPGEHHIVQNRPVSNKEDMTTGITHYYDAQLYDRDDIGQRFIEPNDVYGGMYYETSGSELREYEYPQKIPSYKANTDETDDFDQYENEKEKQNNYYRRNDSSSPGQNDKMKQFKEGVLEKIKQGCYASNSPVTYKPFNSQNSNSSKLIHQSSETMETENEYVRSILNGIPNQSNYKTYNSPVDTKKISNSYSTTARQLNHSTLDRKSYDYDFETNANTWKSPMQYEVAVKVPKKYSHDVNCQNRKTDEMYEPQNTNKSAIYNNPYTYPKTESGSLIHNVNTKSNLTKNELSQMDPNTCMIGKDSTVFENSSHMTNGEDVPSRSYSLRNGFNESNTNYREFNTRNTRDKNFIVINRNSHGMNDSYGNKQQSYRLRNGFSSSNDIPENPEYQVYKKGTFGSTFKKYTRPTSENEGQPSHRREQDSHTNEENIIKPPISEASVTPTESNLPKENLINDSLKSEQQITGNRNETPTSQKQIKKNTDSLILPRDVPKDYNEIEFNYENNKKAESPLTKEFKSRTNTKSDLIEMDSGEIESYYKSDRQEKVTDTLPPTGKSTTETDKKPDVTNKLETDVEPLTSPEVKSTEKNPPGKFQNPEKNTQPSDMELKRFSSKSYNSAKQNKVDIESSTAKQKITPLQKILTNDIIDKNKVQSNSLKLNSRNMDGLLSPEHDKQNPIKSLVNKNSTTKSFSLTDTTSNNNAKKLKLQMDELKERIKARTLNNTYKLLSNSPEPKQTSDNNNPNNEQLSDKFQTKSQGNSVKLGEKGKSENTSVQKTLTPTFSIAIGGESGNKSNLKIEVKEESSKMSEKEPEKSKAINNEGITFTMTGTKGFKLGKCETAQSITSDDNLNKIKSNGFQNNVNQQPESQINVSAAIPGIKTSGKSTSATLHSIKKDEDLEGKNSRMNSVKLVETKITTSLNKLKDKTSLFSSREIPSNLSSAEKITAILKEHRMLLELLLEKLNGRVASLQGDINANTKKLLLTNDELKKIDKSENCSTENYKNEQFKQMFDKCLNSNEKFKRIHPRNNPTHKRNLSSNSGKEESSIETKKTDMAGPTQFFQESLQSNLKWQDITPLKDEKRQPRFFADKPLKRFHVVTMMTSPSGRRIKKNEAEPILDGSKLANYNYSPLKQILSQYKIESLSKPPRLSPTPIFKNLPQYNKNKLTGDFHKNVKTNISSSTSLTHSTWKNSKKKDDRPQIKRTVMVNKKKNYDIKDNIKRKHFSAKDKKIITTLYKVSKLAGNSKREGTLSKKDKLYNEINKQKLIMSSAVPKKDEGKSSNSTFSVTDNRPKILDINKNITTKSIDIKTKSLKNVEKMFRFTTRSSDHSKISSGLENKSVIFNTEFSNNMIKGPTWVPSPEYSCNRDQWNLPICTGFTNNETNNNNKRMNQTKIYPSNTTELSNSNTKTLSLSRGLSTKGAFPRSSTIPVLKSSSLPLTLSFLNQKSINKSKTDLSKTVGIKKISTCNTGKYESDKTKPKIYRNLSYSRITSFPSAVIKSKNSIELINIHNRTKHGTPSKQENPKYFFLGSSKNKKCSLDGRNNLLFGRIKKPNILNTLKPTFLSSRSISHKDSRSEPQEENKLTAQEPCLKPLKDPHIKTTNVNNQYLKSVLQVDSLNTSWIKITTKIKHMVETKLKIKKSCTPNFDEMMASITEDNESPQQKDNPSQHNHLSTNNFSKQARSKELSLLCTNEKSKSKNIQSNGEPKPPIIPLFMAEEVKNF